jgi:nucleotide-binding universal stress UspA family protein
MTVDKRFTSIMVPLDGSDLAERALPVAAGLAREAGVSLHLVAAQEPLTVPLAAEFPAMVVELNEEMRNHLSDYLTRMAGQARQRGAPVVKPALLDGIAARALRQYIQTENIGLVVMTSHGRGGLNRLWLGSVTDRLLRTAGVPILVLKPDRIPETLSCRRIVMALDGEIEQEVLDAGLSLLHVMPDATLLLTRIVEPPVPFITRMAVQPARFGADWIERHEIEARNYLARLADRLRTTGRAVETQTLVGHPVAEKLMALAHAAEADLVVLGTHGSRGVERVLLGSVADKVIRTSDLPVLVAPVHRAGERKQVLVASEGRGNLSTMTR